MREGGEEENGVVVAEMLVERVLDIGEEEVCEVCERLEELELDRRVRRRKEKPIVCGVCG